MNCLCCGKSLDSENENSGWHKNCIKSFFGTETLPEIEIDEAAIEKLAGEVAAKGFTVPGVQKKLSLCLFSEGSRPRLTLLNYPIGFILKPQVMDFDALPEAEQLVMSMAQEAGLDVAPHALISGGGSFAYITKRVDRIFENDRVKMLAMEDFCQLECRLTEDKYRGSYKRCAKIVEKYSSNREHDLVELYKRVVFSYLVGNSDMHLKNLSLVETAEGSGEYVLSPAYDLLPINVVMPEDDEELALALNGKKANIRKKDFLIFAQECGFSREHAEKMIADITSLRNRFCEMCFQSLLPENLKERFAELINRRCANLEG